MRYLLLIVLMFALGCGSQQATKSAVYGTKQHMYVGLKGTRGAVQRRMKRKLRHQTNRLKNHKPFNPKIRYKRGY